MHAIEVVPCLRTWYVFEYDLGILLATSNLSTAVSALTLLSTIGFNKDCKSKSEGGG